MTQFTPASMEVVPCNEHERAFAVSVLMFAMIVFSSFVSSITASMTQLRNMTAIFDKNLSILRRYLRAHEISGQLSIRILRYSEYKLSMRKQEIQESDVNLLRILSAPLRMELVHETLEPILVRHPFFQQFAAVSAPAMRQVCNSALKRQHYSAGDIIFDLGWHGDKMLFLTRGQLKYKLGRRPNSITSSSSSTPTKADSNLANFFRAESRCDASADGDDLSPPSDLVRNTSDLTLGGASSLGPGEWCAEAALWVQWEHVGRLSAEENAEMMSLDALAFAEALSMHKGILRTTICYSNLFVEWLNAQAMTALLTDVPIMDQHDSEEMIRDAFAGDDGPTGRPLEKALVKLFHLKSATFEFFSSEADGQRQGSEDSAEDVQELGHSESNSEAPSAGEVLDNKVQL